MTVSNRAPFLKRLAQPIVEEGLDGANETHQAAKTETARGESRFDPCEERDDR